jgi:hypothetical protein
MASQFSNYGFGKDGVNLVKNPLHLGDGEGHTAAECRVAARCSSGWRRRDWKARGFGGAQCRGAVQHRAGHDWAQSQDGVYQDAVCGAGHGSGQYVSQDDERDGVHEYVQSVGRSGAEQVCGREWKPGRARIAAFRNFIVYPYSTYTVGTNNPPIALWDGTDARSAGSYSGGTKRDGEHARVCDWTCSTANGLIYFAYMTQAARERISPGA